jgi:hypothetical protein
MLAAPAATVPPNGLAALLETNVNRRDNVKITGIRANDLTDGCKFITIRDFLRYLFEY